MLHENVRKIKKPKAISINEYPVENDLGNNIFGVRKYYNTDWTLLTYVIPRNALKENFADDELKFSGIYFLCGNIDGIKQLYVGKAGKRINGESVLRRLREHDKSNTEHYSDIWDTAIIFTTITDVWKDTEISLLEHKLYHLIPKENLINDKIPSSSDVDNDIHYEEKIRQIKSFLNYLGINLFNQEIEEGQVSEITETYKLDNSKVIENLQRSKRAIPEITTPICMVKKNVGLSSGFCMEPRYKIS